jgi:hypothetical protein
MKIFKWTGLVYFSIFILGCEETKLDVDKYGSMTGYVLNGEDYTPLEGVMITTNPATSSVLTDENGIFEIEKVLAGEVAVTARKKDFLSGSVSVSVYEEESTTLTMFLLKDERDVGWVTIYDPVPGNGAVDQPTSLTFQWKVDQENTAKQLEYTVYYFRSGSTVQNIAGENLSAKEVVVDDLDYETTYYWYVVAKYEGDMVANSPTWSFKTVSEPAQ